MNEILKLEIQNKLDTAQPYDIIQLPNELDFPLIISKPCTIMGHDTIIDTSQEDVDYVIKVLSDNVTLSDITIKNKIDNNGIYIKTNNSSIERINITECDICIFIEKSNNIDLIELKALNSNTGIRIKDSKNLELNACSSYNNSIGVDIIGSSSILGNVDSYQGFGLNINLNDISPLIEDEEYEFKIDGMFFSFKATYHMTYEQIILAINNMIGFNPTYNAEFYNNDIIIKTQLQSLNIENTSNTLSLINTLNIPLKNPVNNINYSYARFGLNVDGNSISPIIKGTIYTFVLDGSEIQFFSNENDGTTYNELITIISNKINSLGYIIEFKNNDIYISKIAPSVILTNGTRFGRLFTILNTIPSNSIFVIESYQLLGLNILQENLLDINSGKYSLSINNIEYNFNITETTTYLQLIDILNISFGNKYIASIENNDIKILTNSPFILIEKPKFNFFETLSATPLEAIIGIEENRTDRSHHINIIGSLIYENQIGARLTNVNDIIFVGETKIFSNTNIGLWQLPNSYNTKFRGEIYNNTNYGIRNTDKLGGIHDIDAMDSWWGDRTGPGMFGPGEGDKISANVLFKPARQNGTVPDLSYPKTRQFILNALGYPIVKVELTDEQILECIDKAIFKFMQYRTPEREQRYVEVRGGGNMVKLPLDLPKEEIIEVTYSPNADIFAQLSGSGESFYLTYYMQNTGGTFLSDFYVAMAYKETMEQTLGIWPSYELLSGKDVDGSNCDYIRLSPRPTTGLKLGILFSRPMAEDEADQQEWIHKYSLAWAKEILGRVRSKYGSVPGPSGEMSLDGATLLSEAQQEKEKLEAEIINISEPLGFIVG